MPCGSLYTYLIIKFNSRLITITGVSLLIIFLPVGVWGLFLSSGEEWVLEWLCLSKGGIVFRLLVVFDFIGATFLRTVRIIAGAVFIYSGSYIIEEKFFSRFGMLVFLFVLSM